MISMTVSGATSGAVGGTEIMGRGREGRMGGGRRGLGVAFCYAVL